MRLAFVVPGAGNKCDRVTGNCPLDGIDSVRSFNFHNIRKIPYKLEIFKKLFRIRVLVKYLNRCLSVKPSGGNKHQGGYRRHSQPGRFVPQLTHQHLKAEKEHDELYREETHIETLDRRVG